MLFTHYPDIEVAYELICQFRAWYSADLIIDQNKDKLSEIATLNVINHNQDQWMNEVDKADITEIQNFKSLVERNRGCIINYFITGTTNAVAEANNNIIQTFLMTN